MHQTGRQPETHAAHQRTTVPDLQIDTRGQARNSVRAIIYSWVVIYRGVLKSRSS